MPTFTTPRNLKLLFSSTNLLGLFLYLVALPELWLFSATGLAGYLLFTNMVTLGILLFSSLARPFLLRIRHGFAIAACLAGFTAIVFVVSLAGAWLADLLHLHPWNMVGVLDSTLHRTALGVLFAVLIWHYMWLREQFYHKRHSEMLARLHTMQTRLRPHFFFNAMNTVSALVRIDPEQAENAIDSLSRLLRTSMTERGEITLEEEIAICHDYLLLEQLRFGDRFSVSWHLPPATGTTLPVIPALCLQSVLESLIHFGVEKEQAHSSITIHISLKHGRMQIEITSPMLKHGVQSRESAGIFGQVENRLKHYYGSTSSLGLSESDGVCKINMSYPQQ